MLALVDGQRPVAAWLGCADSRLPVELLFDTGFGDLFVVRHAGTISTPAAIASIESTVGHLGVPLIVVLGHESSGAVSAALDPPMLLTLHLAQVVGQLPMELLQDGAQHVLKDCCRRQTLVSAASWVNSSVLLTDQLLRDRVNRDSGLGLNPGPPNPGLLTWMRFVHRSLNRKWAHSVARGLQAGIEP